MADGWIKLFDVEADEAELLVVFDRFEPVDYGFGVFALVEEIELFRFLDLVVAQVISSARHVRSWCAYAAFCQPWHNHDASASLNHNIMEQILIPDLVCLHLQR